MSRRSFRFGEFSLHPAARQLLHGTTAIDVPRRVFDCLAYLLLHRERAVGRDELIEQVWKRDNVSDNQLAQTVLAARKLIADDGVAQRMIRTVPGFGYHWVGAVEPEDEELASVPVAASVAAMPAAAAEPIADATPTPISPPTPPAAHAPTRAWFASAWLLAGLLALGVWWSLARVVAPPPVVATAGPGVLWVLPAQLPDASESWARVGLMALVAEDLRRRGAVVMPVENVLVRLRDAGERPSPEQLLVDTAAAALVAPTVRRTGERWVVELAHLPRDGAAFRLQAEDADLLTAARRAATQLGTHLHLAGVPAVDPGQEADAMIAQAIRSRDDEGARTQLARLSPAAAARPQTALLEIQLDLEMGRYAAARERIDRLAATLDAKADPGAHASLQLQHAALLRKLDEPGWEPLAREVVALLEGTPLQRELATALQLRGTASAREGRLLDAAQDFARAREISLALLDELGAASAASNLARISMLEGRPAEALEQLQQALAVFTTYGAEGAMLRALRAIQSIQFGMRRWEDALATTERMRELQERSRDLIERVTYLQSRTMAMIGLGRLREADALLEAVVQEDAHGELTREAHYTAAAYRTQLALARGQWQDAASAAAAGFELVAERSEEDFQEQREQFIYLQMLALQRAHSDAWPAPAPGAQASIDRGATSFALLARALLLAHRGDLAPAEQAFREGMEAAEKSNRLARILGAAEAWIEFLLAEGRVEDASQVLRRLLARDPGLADRDYEAALLTLEVARARGDNVAWRNAATRALELAGERVVPHEWLP